MATAAILGTLGNCSRPSGKVKHMNFICIYSDEMDPTYLSCYGGKIPTPHLDALAGEGMRFTHAYTAAPMCTPSRFSLLTGKYAGRCTHPDFLEAFPETDPYSIAWNTFLDPSIPTIARILSEHGYITGMAGKWHLSALPESIDIPQFNADDDPGYENVMEKLKTLYHIQKRQVQKDSGFDVINSLVWENFDVHPLRKLHIHNFPWISKGALDFLDQQAKTGKPFFLYAATTAVHGPYHVDALNHDLRYTPEGYVDDVMDYELDRGKIKEALKEVPAHEHHKYAGMACLDHHVGLIMKKLKTLNLDQNTVIFFMSDHNTEPGKATCYEKGNRIPMIVKWPGKSQSGTTSDALVQTIDILPTILAAAGIPVFSGCQLNGQNILPIIENKSEKGKYYVYFESGYARAVTDGKWKYMAVRYPKEVIEKLKNGTMKFAPNHLAVHKQAHSQIALQFYPGYFDPDQLYNLKNDPYEQHNLADDPKYGDNLKRMKKLLAEHLQTFNHPFDLSEEPFLKSKRYRELAQKTKAIGTNYIPWLPRDHGAIVWPPE